MTSVSQAEDISIGGKKLSRRLIPFLLGGFILVGSIAFMASYSSHKSPSEMRAEREEKEKASALEREKAGTGKEMKEFLAQEEADRQRKELAARERAAFEASLKKPAGDQPPLPSGDPAMLAKLRETREYATARQEGKSARGDAPLPSGSPLGFAGAAANEKPFESYPGQRNIGMVNEATADNLDSSGGNGDDIRNSRAIAANNTAGNARVAELRQRQDARDQSNQRMVNDLRAQQQAAATQPNRGQGAPSNSDPSVWQKNVATAPKNAEAITPERILNNYVLTEGTTIPAVTVTKISSDLPGQIQARTTLDVYNSLLQGGRFLLIPKGSLLVGQYRSEVKLGEERVMFAFTRIILTDGRSIQLPGMAAGDAQGASGIEGDVNNHWIKQFGPAVLTALIGWGIDRQWPSTPTNGNNSNTGTVVVSGSQSNNSADVIRQVAPDIAKRSMDRFSGIKPTIEIPVGTKFNIMVSRDIALPPGSANAVSMVQR